MFKVSEGIHAELLTLPESGMGWQVVDATYRDGETRETLVLNATLAEATEGRDFEVVLNAMASDAARVNYAYRVYEPSDEIVSVSPRQEAGRVTLRESGAPSSVGAMDAPRSATLRGEMFIRFSAFEDDRRVDRINKRLLPGTFATTLEDAKFCLENHLDPIARYALPTLRLMEWLFHIKPLENTAIQRGTVQENFGQPGGGAEVYFPDGTDKGTVVKEETLGTARL